MKSNLISEKTISYLNFRIQQEEESSRLYEQMHLWLEDRGYLNTSKLYKKYSDEERSHAGWAKSYLLDFGVTPTLYELEAPSCMYEGLKDIFTKTLEHEELITTQIKEIGQEALKESDFVLFSLVIKYQAEQQEEIGKAITLLDISELSFDNLILDKYIGENLL